MLPKIFRTTSLGGSSRSRRARQLSLCRFRAFTDIRTRAWWRRGGFAQSASHYAGFNSTISAATSRPIGVLNAEHLKRLNYLPVFFTAAALCMGDVLLRTNALQAMTAVMFAWMRPLVTHGYSLAVVPYWTAFVYHILLGNEISMLATSMPALMNFATSNGIAALPLGLIWAFAAGGKIFVYQSGVMVTGYSYGYFEARDMFRVGLCLTVLESLLLLLVVPFYWPLIGIH